MRRAKIGTLLILLSMVIVWLHMLALKYEWYFHLPYSDVLMHLLGGAIVGFFVLFIYEISGYTKEIGELFTILLWTFVVAIGWEVFELLFGLHATTSYIEDTIMDIIFGLIGASLAVFISQTNLLYDKTT